MVQVIRITIPTVPVQAIQTDGATTTINPIPIPTTSLTAPDTVSVRAQLQAVHTATVIRIQAAVRTPDRSHQAIPILHHRQQAIADRQALMIPLPPEAISVQMLTD